MLEALECQDAWPKNYVTITEFCKLSQTNDRKIIREACETGRIPRKHLVTKNSGKTKKLLIDWDATGYDYVKSKQTGPPPDFILNKEKLYNPILAKGNATPLSTPGLDIFDASADVVYEPVTDIVSAKFRKEQLNIIKLQEELRLEANETIRISDVQDKDVQVAAELRAALKSMVYKVAPEIVGRSDVMAIRRILENRIGETIAELMEDEG
jgi:hypothetical protein